MVNYYCFGIIPIVLLYKLYCDFACGPRAE